MIEAAGAVDVVEKSVTDDGDREFSGSSRRGGARSFIDDGDDNGRIGGESVRSGRSVDVNNRPVPDFVMRDGSQL